MGNSLMRRFKNNIETVVERLETQILEFANQDLDDNLGPKRKIRDAMREIDNSNEIRRKNRMTPSSA